ncbi:hypothetical protein I5J06_10950 [Pseudomonas aeruginosa]|nr:hypothetical protein [Pseudomonas aeruginosa]
MVNGSASGYFEIYIPSESPADTEVISRARLGRRAGEVSVEVFLSGFSWAVAGAECNTVIELKPEHHAALPWHFA